MKRRNPPVKLGPNAGTREQRTANRIVRVHLGGQVVRVTNRELRRAERRGQIMELGA